MGSSFGAYGYAHRLATASPPDRVELHGTRHHDCYWDASDEAPASSKEVLVMTTPVTRRRPFEATAGRAIRRARASSPKAPSPRHHRAERPIIAAVEASETGTAAARSAARLARELEAPLTFVYVRRWPWAGLGAPYYQRRLDAEMAIARRALRAALATAEKEGVHADGEILEGRPARRVVEFARDRAARLVVLGSRRRRIGRSVSRRVIRASDRPVVVAGSAPVSAPAAA